MVREASAYQGVLGILPRLSERMVSVLIERKNFRGLTPLFGSERIEADHKELIEMLKTIRGKAMHSGHPSSLYDSLGWEKRERRPACSAADRTRNSGPRGAGMVPKLQERTGACGRGTEISPPTPFSAALVDRHVRSEVSGQGWSHCHPPSQPAIRDGEIP